MPWPAWNSCIESPDYSRPSSGMLTMSVHTPCGKLWKLNAKHWLVRCTAP